MEAKHGFYHMTLSPPFKPFVKILVPGHGVRLAPWLHRDINLGLRAHKGTLRQTYQSCDELRDGPWTCLGARQEGPSWVEMKGGCDSAPLRCHHQRLLD